MAYEFETLSGPFIEVVCAVFMDGAARAGQSENRISFAPQARKPVGFCLQQPAVSADFRQTPRF